MISKGKAGLLLGTVFLSSGIAYSVTATGNQIGVFKPEKPAGITIPDSAFVKVFNRFTGKPFVMEIRNGRGFSEDEDMGIVTQFINNDELDYGSFLLNGKPFIRENGVYQEVNPETGNAITEESPDWNCKTQGNKKCGKVETEPGIPSDCIPRDSRVKVRVIRHNVCEFTYPPGVNEFYPNGTKATYRVTGNPDEPLIRVS